MTWVLMILGALAGALIGGGALDAAVLGAVIGLTIGQTRAMRQLRALNTELRENLKTFETRFEKGTSAVVERLRSLEANASSPPPAATPESTRAASVEESPGATAAMQEEDVTEPSPTADVNAMVAEAVDAISNTPASSDAIEPEADIAQAAMSTDEMPPATDVATAVTTTELGSTTSLESSTKAKTNARPASIRPGVPRTRHREPSLFDKAFAAAKNWLLGGNVVLRIGVLLLFLGLAFLLRYATKDIVIPTEVYYAGVALAGLAMIALGWTLRRRNENYALIMQGAGIGVMYLTVFAAFRLHPLLPSGMALTFLVLLTVALIALALLQNAVGLASAAVAGAFAAPILTSTGSGNHVALFSYFALLNSALMIIAWYKAWRVLNMIGFAGTFGIGFAWGMRSYTPALFASTEPFLVLFFVMYVAIGLLFTRRKLLEVSSMPPTGTRELFLWSTRQGDYVDATLMFGPPLVGFGLQYAVISHMEFGAAFSALAMGIFYLGLAINLKQRTHAQAQLLVEVCLALGVIFGTLAMPLALDANWTAAAWAVEGAGLYWVGQRQQRSIARLFSLLLQFAAAFNYLGTLESGDDTLLQAAPLGSLLLGVALLFSHGLLLRATRSTQAGLNAADEASATMLVRWEQKFLPALACTGLASLYLLAPLFFLAQGTALLWALGGLITLFFGLRLGSKSYLLSAFVVQLLGGVVFLTHMEWSDGAGGALVSGWRGLLAASWIGVAMIAGMVMASRHSMIRNNSGLLRSLAGMLLLGLVFINLAVLFVLPWRSACAVWGVSGLVILWLAVQGTQRVAFWFACLLELVAGITFLFSGDFFGESLALQAQELTLRPLLHAGFWTPAVLALAAFIGAWRLHVVAKNIRSTMLPWMSETQLRRLSTTLLAWSAAWWVFTGLTEIARFVAVDARINVALVVAAGSVACWAWIARRAEWKALAHACLSLLIAATITLLVQVHDSYHPLAEWGWLAWAITLVVHFWQLKQLPSLLRSTWLSAAHVLGCWLLLALFALELHYGFSQLAEPGSAWRWLGWVLAPTAYLLLMVSDRPMPWPVSEFAREYHSIATLPVAVVLLGWFWIANAESSGNASPLPFLPLVNPLELALLLALMGVGRWLHKTLPTFAPGLPQPKTSLAVVGASLFVLLTACVFRTAHHWADIPYRLDVQLTSMLVQASLSILWTTIALGLMIVGHRNGHRQLWLVGGALIGVVVAKLFFVELGNRGGLERVISFMGVGVLLLIVGYFAPLPPRQKESVDENTVA